MTLITWQSSGGERRRCDAHCYGAKTLRCTCICGGRNHGQGLEQARAQTAAWAEAELVVLAARGDAMAQAILDGIRVEAAS
jgi:hypothetical protein